MKKYLFILLVCLINDLNAQIINFPDLNFKNRLLQSTAMVGNFYFIASNVSGNNMAVDANQDGEIEVNEAQAVYKLTVQNCNISNLSGIEYFTNITNLNCADNLLTSLDVSNLTNLQIFRCDRNNINYLNTNGLMQIRSFYYGTNHLPNFNINAHPSVNFLGCDRNQIINLDISGLPYLTVLQCDNNSIQSLDLSHQSFLRNLTCSNNLLTDLDASRMDYVSLNCSYNPLINLNLKVGNAFSYQSMTSTNMNLSNCPTLLDVCVDQVNVVNIQNKINGYGYTNCSVNSNCNLSTESFSSLKRIKLFPNPVNNILQIETEFSLTESTIFINNTSGQTVLVSDTKNNNNFIDVSKLSRGVYFIKIIMGGEILINKFIKE